MGSVFVILQRFLPEFLKGTAVTLELTAVGILLGFALGLTLALMRAYGQSRCE
jgi:ABC-type amino acid transport system permease subunit